jgi:hypothetical protein
MRRLAVHVLLVWLFALTAGVVNACVVEPELRRMADAAADESAAAPSAHLQVHAVAAVDDQHPTPHADKLPCEKFCTDESVSAPASKQQSEVSTTVWLAPPPTASPAVEAALARVGVDDARLATIPARVPIPIAFLRLTL